MARSVNKVIVIGNLGQDPEVRYTPSGSAVATVSLATSDVWRDKQSGELQERTEWHRIVFFNKLAEIVGQYLRKGSRCYVEGSLRTRKWQDKNGQDRYTTEIIASEMCMLDSRASSAERAALPSQPSSDTTGSQVNEPMLSDETSLGGESKPTENTADKPQVDDDVPF